jgi:hypothetical protein
MLTAPVLQFGFTATESAKRAAGQHDWLAHEEE